MALDDLSEAERHEITREGNGLDPDAEAISLYDVANSKLFARQHAKRLRYCEELGGYLEWTGKYWAPERNDQVTKYAIQTAESLWTAVTKAKTEEERKQAFKVYAYAQKATSLRAMIALARHQLATDADSFDSDPYALNCLNGTVDLRTGKLRKHDPNDYITKLIRVRFNPKAKAPRWERFMKEILPVPRVREYVQRAAGHSITGDTREQAIWLLIGEGSNGKGVFTQIIRKVIGPYGSTGRPQLLMSKQHEPENNEDLWTLRGQRFVEVSETKRGHLDEQQVKVITGEDTIKASAKYKSVAEFRPTHHIWLRTNDRPIITGTDYAIWRRVKLINFSVRFVTKAEYAKEIKGNPALKRDPCLRIRDTGLTAALERELEGVLVWLVRGSVRWFRRGHKPDLREPPGVTRAVEQYRSDSDRFGDFLQECCERDPQAKTLTRVLHSAYKAWAEERGFGVMNDQSFGLALNKRGFAQVAIGTMKGRRGLRLQTWAQTLARLDSVSPDKKKRYAR